MLNSRHAYCWLLDFARTMISFGGSGNPLGRVLKSVYAPGASSIGIPDCGGPALKCLALTVTRYCVLGDKPVIVWRYTPGFTVRTCNQ